MSNFHKIINKVLKTLNEDGSIQSTNSPITNNVVSAFDDALSRSGAVNSNANAVELRDKLFGTSPDDSTNPLHSAFDKIKSNPDNPNLEDHEKKAFLDAASKIQPTNDSDVAGDTSTETDSTTGTSTSTTGSGSSGTQETGHQPNSKTYNPLDQSV